MAEPFRAHRPHGFEPGEPHVPPSRADDGGIGRARRIAELGDDRIRRRGGAASARIAQGIAIVDAGGAHDGLERRRAPRRRLQRDGAAPGQPEHRDLARAPGLAREPFDHGGGVFGVLRAELVAIEAFQIAGAAHINANAAIAVSREIAMRGRVADRRHVALAIRHEFENRRNALGRHVRQPLPRGKTRAVGQRNPQILDFARSMRKVGDAPHATRSARSCSARLADRAPGLGGPR